MFKGVERVLITTKLSIQQRPTFSLFSEVINNFELVRLARAAMNKYLREGNTYLHNPTLFSIIEQDGQTCVPC